MVTSFSARFESGSGAGRRTERYRCGLQRGSFSSPIERKSIGRAVTALSAIDPAQRRLRTAGYAQKDLSKQIEAVLAETDTTKALPTGIHSIVDAIRNFGNFSAHKITDQTTLQVIDVEPHEAEFCLDLLDALFDHYYTRPALAKRVKDELNRKLAAANKPLVK